MGVKLSISLPEDDVAYLDSLVSHAVAGSRSGALHDAVVALRESRLESAYESAWDEWSAGGEAQIWESARGDGLDATG